MMVEEASVLRRDHCIDESGGHPIDRHEVVAPWVFRVLDPALDLYRRDRRIDDPQAENGNDRRADRHADGDRGELPEWYTTR
jgi:hypothetical protein